MKVELHIPGSERSDAAKSSWLKLLQSRRSQFLQLINDRLGKDQANKKKLWSARSIPMLSILAPVLSTHEHKIEFPGDPMCLYSALSMAVGDAMKTFELGFDAVAPFNDFCPRLAPAPSLDYRLNASASGMRPFEFGENFCSDHSIFDPRVWNQTTEAYFRGLLRHMRPRIVAVSTVSPGHRYAVRILRAVREELPHCLTILGGRHIDETVRWDDQKQELHWSESSTIAAIDEEIIPDDIDFLMSGEGYYALPLLLKSISLSFDLDELPAESEKRVSLRKVIEMLDLNLAAGECVMKGSAVICALESGTVHAFPLKGQPVLLHELPSPYSGFAIRAEFPVFPKGANGVKRTAHINASHACAFRCEYCSEGFGVLDRRFITDDNDASWVLDRIVELAKFGAEAVFFDDSLLLSANIRRIESFCNGMKLLRQNPGQLPITGGALDRFLHLEWGGQLSIALLNGFNNRGLAVQLLKEMATGGCSYVYFGIESMAPSVAAGLHKNRSSTSVVSWPAQVRNVLTLVKEAGIRAGASILFGLEAENKETVDFTIREIESLLDDELLYIVSPNLCTYHPGTPLTKRHGTERLIKLGAIFGQNAVRPPYSFFEEAFPGMISRNLTEDIIWHIHRETLARWKKGRNLNPVARPIVPAI